MSFIPGLANGVISGKKFLGWAGNKSQGANATNDALDERYTMLTGTTPGRVGKLNPATGRAYEDPNRQVSPLKGLIGDITRSRDESRERSDRLFGESENNFRGFMGSSGGLDPSRIAALEGDIAGFRNIGRHGAADEASANRIRGGGVYDEFSKTGGYSEGDKQNIRARANSVIPAFFANLKENLGRTNRVQGGFNPGYTSQMSRLARDSGKEAQGAAREAELGIMDRVNEGRRWGTEGMTKSEQAIVANMLAGLEGASGTESALMNAIRQGQMFGAQGMESLRTTPGADLAHNNQLLQALGMEDDQITRLLGMKGERNPNVNNWDKYGGQIMSGVSGALGALSDVRTKENVKSFNRGLNEIKQIVPVEFNYKSEYGGQHNVSVMAQEIEKIMPEAVFTGADGFKRVNLSVVMMALLNAVKELEARK